jgi:VWFA-related protein
LNISVALIIACTLLAMRVHDQPPTFTTSVDLVALTVVVTDEHGRAVTNLIERDLVVSEDGHPQTLAQFSNVPPPASIAVALDTSASMRGERFRQARQAVWRLLDRLAPQDELTIYGFNNRPYSIVGWTSSRNLVVMSMSGVEPMRVAGFTALFEAVRIGFEGFRNARQRQRALLVLSDGNDELPNDMRFRDGTHPFPGLNLSAQTRLRHVVDYVTRSEGLVYAIGLAEKSSREEPLDGAALKALSAPTGGFATMVNNDSDIPAAVDKVIDDLRTQYLVAFVPTHAADGKFHKLTVTVRGCSCHARARSGFVHAR